ncbi:MAG: metallophosphoesterase, partial [Clostridia bacterium]|nr:metallophosphoesterase [Clostridia bacterium]
KNDVELVLIAGDVFDTFLPQAEAESLFFRTVRRLAGENRAVLIISGNHDDGVRLAAATPLAEELGVYVVGNHTGALPLHSARPCPPRKIGRRLGCLSKRKRGGGVYQYLTLSQRIAAERGKDGRELRR